MADRHYVHHGHHPHHTGVMNDTGPPRKEIYTYNAPWTVFAVAWSRRFVILQMAGVVCCLLAIATCDVRDSNNVPSLVVSIDKTHHHSFD